MVVRGIQVVLLCGVALLVSLGAALLQSVPGYMDAEYYYANGMQIAAGQGWYENFLWNYLDDPAGLPHPAFTYWMPLASWLAAVGMRLAGSPDFLSARLVMILLAACMPLMTMTFSLKMLYTPRNAWLAALLALFPGFYLIFSTNTDTFTPYMILGGLFLITGFADFGLFRQFFMGRFFVLGVVAGAMHFARADGILWLVAACALGIWYGLEKRKENARSFAVILVGVGISIGMVLVGYLLVMSPWLWRNFRVFGSLLPPGGRYALWLTEYDQLFAYPASSLTARSWLQAGWEHHLQTWFESFSTNLQTFVAVQGQVFLFPLILWGGWRLRNMVWVRFGFAMWLATFLVMTFVFPFAGQRGGFFHSGAAFQVFFWLLVPYGLEGFVQAGSRLRGWKSAEAWSVFAAALIAGGLIMSLALFWLRVIGGDWRNPLWTRSWETHRQIAKGIQDFGADCTTAVMINNPPGYYAATHCPAIVIPNGDEQILLQVAKRYQVRLVVLERNHPRWLSELYEKPGSRPPHLHFLGTIGDAKIYRVEVDL